jgi:hypothetical protein
MKSPADAEVAEIVAIATTDKNRILFIEHLLLILICMAGTPLS